MTSDSPVRHRGPVAARALLALCALCALPAGSPAQGCPMCRETAAFQKDRAIGALQRGIVALAVPPAAIAGGLVWLTWSRSRHNAID